MPKSTHLDQALVGEDQVLRRHVAVDDVERRAVGHRLARARSASPRTPARSMPHATSCGTSPSCLRGALAHHRHRQPGHELHRHEVLALDLAELEHLHDVRVRQPRVDARLVEEHLDVLVVDGELVEQPLDDDELLEARHARDARQPDLRHSARREQREEIVFTEARRGRHARGEAAPQTSMISASFFAGDLVDLLDALVDRRPAPA